MIPTDRLLAEMERQLLNAKNAGDEQARRESLSAIRSLCEVALGTTEVPPPRLQTIQQAPSIRHEKLQEDDANGDSIFDF